MSNTSWSNEEIAYAIIAKAEGKHTRRFLN